MTARPRRGLVLGGGGVLGGTWAVGALVALEQVHGVRPADLEVIVGTSVGSVLGALLGSGVTPNELRQHYSEQVVESGPLRGLEWDPDAAVGGHRPGLPSGIGPGSLRLIGSALRHPAEVRPATVVAALMPAGGRSLAGVGRLIDAVTPFGEWSPHRNCWVVAMDYDTGRRVVFGRPGSPALPLSVAVMASCAIPGWFEPVHAAGRTFVDGGAVSATSVDVVEHLGLDEVYVIAPMVSFDTDHPRAPIARLERRWREEVTKACMAEAQQVAAAGAVVRVVGMSADDLAAMGTNLMDAGRRRHVLDTSLRTSVAAWQQPVTVAAAP